MSGWWIVISTQPPTERDVSYDEPRRSAICAQWEVAGSGIEWIKSLVSAGKALQLSNSGYPNRYIAAADDVFSALGFSAANNCQVQSCTFSLPGESHSHVQIDHVKIASCGRAKRLTIEAWDPD